MLSQVSMSDINSVLMAVVLIIAISIEALIVIRLTGGVRKKQSATTKLDGLATPPKVLREALQGQLDEKIPKGSVKFTQGSI